ncbi:hypothetical protein LUZ60_015526 [Juncus effusus]|nr:hypothetical protein LUZ60_015526 [Juncus effusus]
MAILTRFLLGALNGLLGPIRAYSVEVCNQEHQALGLSMYSTAWGIGLIVGPAVGGYLAQETLHNHSTNENLEALEASLGHSKKPNNKINEEIETLPPKQSLFRNWPLISSIIVYCIFCLDDMAYTEIFSLWPKVTSYGGLSFLSQQVGQVLAISGFGLLVFQLFVYPRLEKIIGAIIAVRIGAILSMPLLFGYPLMTYLSGLGLTIILNFASMLKNILSVAIITGTFILQNNAVHQDQRGAADGLSVTGMSLCKAVAPGGGGIM